MFAYCLNNPVVLADPSGTCANTFSIYFKVDCGKNNCKTSSAYLPIEKRLEQKGVSYEPSSSGNGGRIINSYKVTDPTEQTEFAIYLKTHTDNFSGSIEGILYEWAIHNLLFEVTKEGDPWHDRAKDVDLGRTIYDDNHGVFSKIMWIGFEILYPQQAIDDRIATNTK